MLIFFLESKCPEILKNPASLIFLYHKKFDILNGVSRQSQML